jgi:hypothetical protein
MKKLVKRPATALQTQGITNRNHFRNSSTEQKRIMGIGVGINLEICPNRVEPERAKWRIVLRR